MSNDEVKLWLKEFLGDSLIKIIGRKKSIAKCLVIVEGGEEREVIISLPTKTTIYR